MLISRGNARTGANDRIAYLEAGYVPQGLNALFAGDAVIYNADRLRNTTAIVNAWTVRHDNTSVTGVHMRTSFPCVSPSTTFSRFCTLLDGDGRHWVSAHIDPVTRRWQSGPEAVAFELVADPGKHILVYNVHAHPDDPGSYPAIQRLVDQTWAAWLPRTKLLPPIAASDFNGDPTLRNFDKKAESYVDFALMGQPSTYASVYAPTAATEVAPATHDGSYCGSVAVLWSDHCGVFVQYLPSR